MSTPHTSQILVGAVAGVMGLLVGLLVGHTYFGKSSSFLGGELREEGNYKLISPLLACMDGPPVLPQDVLRMREDVTSRIQAQTASGLVSDVAVYYRDLSNGPWFGVNENLTFTPGSLIKVPTMIAYFKAQEENPEFKNLTAVYTKKGIDIEQTIPIRTTLEEGRTYRTDELLAQMITESDNYAAHALVGTMGSTFISDIFAELGIEVPVEGMNYEISVKNYASFFRLLFNATYIEPRHSEQALELLTRTTFTEGIVAGVPQGVTVAHKFGERVIGDMYQLHDCGIVYVPGRPYTLCVMTRGHSQQTLMETIRDISATIYEHSTR